MWNLHINTHEDTSYCPWLLELWLHGCIYLSKSKLGFPGGSEVENGVGDSGGMASIPGSRRSPGEGNGHPLQFSCLGSPMDRSVGAPMGS